MTEPTTPNQAWFAVRCVMDHRNLGAYEERITLWQAASFDEAIVLAENEARDYAHDLETTTYAGLAQAYQLFDQPGHGAEIFSLMRDSMLPMGEYLTAFFDTGFERQQDSTKA
jgi:hypothetical protein